MFGLSMVRGEGDYLVLGRVLGLELGLLELEPESLED